MAQYVLVAVCVRGAFAMLGDYESNRGFCSRLENEGES